MEANQFGGEQDERVEAAAAETAVAASDLPEVEASEEPATPSVTGLVVEGNAPATSPPDLHDEGLLRDLAERVEYLVRLLEESNRLSQERERIIDRLHQENQQLRQGELQQAMLPVMRDLVRLYDDLTQRARGYASRAEATPQEAARDFDCFAEMVTDILYRQGVERYGAREGDAFSSKEHRALGAVQTPEQERERTVARVVRDGFRSESRVIRILEAEVYRYVPAAASPAVEVGGDDAGEAR
jgi:molecular chaperone GrpE